MHSKHLHQQMPAMMRWFNEQPLLVSLYHSWLALRKTGPAPAPPISERLGACMEPLSLSNTTFAIDATWPPRCWICFLLCCQMVIQASAQATRVVRDRPRVAASQPCRPANGLMGVVSATQDQQGGLGVGANFLLSGPSKGSTCCRLDPSPFSLSSLTVIPAPGDR